MLMLRIRIAIKGVFRTLRGEEMSSIRTTSLAAGVVAPALGRAFVMKVRFVAPAGIRDGREHRYNQHADERDREFFHCVLLELACGHHVVADLEDGSLQRLAAARWRYAGFPR
jgi:hypothetical protein